MSSGNAKNGLLAPQFKAIVVMPDDQCKDISLSDYREKYAVFFFYPLDFTFKQGGLGPVNIPLISDPQGTIAQDYGVLKADEGISFRPFLLLTIKTTTNDLPVGHSVDETLRLVQAFPFIDTHGKVCPAGWKSGSDTIKSDVQKSKEYFSK
ncbi:PRDX1 [Cervus elaphus hippelaphus]|uniref:Peroxiredoxin-1 n=1 Tax=Cervus elaphus hippelaphus TaxID=46360 RepID=A0A212CFD5_CEREH|nr:PRDX1 [Cervus elaphus hippelaphus]